MSVDLTPWTLDVDQIAFSGVEQSSHLVCLIVWAVLSNLEFGDFISHHALWSQGPLSTGHVFPFKVDTVTAWVVDPDVVPVVRVARFDVLSALKVESDRPDIWHIKFPSSGPVDNILVWLVAWTSNFQKIAIWTIGDLGSLVALLVIWAVLANVE